MILVTGAAGKTGKALLKALARRGSNARAWIRDASTETETFKAGAGEVVFGDMMEEADWLPAMRGISAVYLICPNMSPVEMDISRLALRAAQQSGVKHIVYHSVLHPQVEAMPHHWSKMRVEEMVFASGLNFTILQPTAYMQNVLAYWNQITGQGLYALPYAPESRLSLVDLEDVAEAASLVLDNPVHYGAIYELVGTGPLSQRDAASILARELGRLVEAVQIDREEWAARARATAMPDYSVDTLLKMFEYYERYGLWGNPNTLGWLLHRTPVSFEQFIRRTIDSNS